MLTTKDYAKILKFYNVTIPKLKKSRRAKVHRILAGKLCRCIKSVKRKKHSEGAAIGICTKIIFTRKGIKRHRFTCKKRRRLLAKNRHVLTKIVKRS